MKSKLLFIVSILVSFFLLSAILPDQGDPWEVPEKYQKLKNPFQADKESINIGKALYSQHCKSCHGKEGLGDGPKAAQLDTPSGDFSTEEFHAQSDGSLFYKIRVGRDDMPAFEKKISDEEDVWHVVNFIRTLGE